MSEAKALQGIDEPWAVQGMSKARAGQGSGGAWTGMGPGLGPGLGLGMGGAGRRVAGTAHMGDAHLVADRGGAFFAD
jgi:hypothetical protein